MADNNINVVDNANVNNINDNNENNHVCLRCDCISLTFIKIVTFILVAALIAGIINYIIELFKHSERTIHVNE